jgi:hypothetical protein
MMVDLETDRLSYRIISFGKVLDLGVSLFQDAPGYSEDRWPDTAYVYWAKIVAEYWN